MPSERLSAVRAFERSGLTQRQFAAHFGITANTLGAWLRGYRERGEEGLERMEPGPRRPRGAKPMPEGKQKAIVEVKRRFPTFGLRKVRDFLARFGGVRVSAGGVRAALDRAGVKPTPSRRARRRAAPPRRFERSRPGELWQSDITYLHVPWSRRPLYLIVFIDDFSRYVVSSGLHLQQRQEIAIEALLLGIAKFGRPKEVLTDQGRQYFAWRGKNDFQRLLVREGIAHVVARAHHPETVGKCERFWETLKRELWDHVAPRDLDDARSRLSHYLAHYNHFRPHQAIEGMTPADRFFGLESEVRKAVEAAMDRNELLLAIGEAPRKPVFLVGQIGDRSVSLVGERGRVVLQTDDGVVREIDMEEMGVPKEVRDGGRDEERGRGAEAAQASAGAQADEVPGSAEDAAAGAGALAGGERGGARAGAPLRGGGDRGVAREDDARGGGGAAVDAAASLLAALPAGGGGDGGGAAAPAPREAGTAPRADARPVAGPQAAAPAHHGARGGALDGEDADRDPARAAGAPGGAPASGGERCGPPTQGEGADGPSSSGCEPGSERCEAGGARGRRSRRSSP
jgi:transposase InsO family protein